MFRLLKYYLFTLLLWMAFFTLAKLFFLLYNLSSTSILSFREILSIFFYGFKLDMSVTGYISAFAFLLSILFQFYGFQKKVLLVVKYYSASILILMSLLVLIDLELYKHWGFRLDNTPLAYIKTPGAMFASLLFKDYLKIIFFGIAFSVIVYYMFKKYVSVALKTIYPASLFHLPINLLFTALLMIIIRGGLGIAPVNLSSAYFTNKTFANHAALNLVWNVGYSITNLEEENTKYNFYTEGEIHDILGSAQTMKYFADTDLVKINRPNIVLLILESFTAKAIGAFGGLDSITPNINKLAQEGFVFTNFYASGSRSDKGMAALLASFPPFGNFSILKYPNKIEKLPGLANTLAKNGYKTGFYYGGDLAFANFNSFMLNNGFQQLTSSGNFSSKLAGYSKWGVPDEFVFNKLLMDCKQTTAPFFHTLFTLSSHLPFEVPMKTQIEGASEERKFLNSMYYTDKCLGNFIDSLKKCDFWGNTLVIVTADHGSRLPGNTEHNMPESYHIPMIWLGGALNLQGKTNNSFCSQLDIAPTLMHQLNMDATEFIFGRDIFEDPHNKIGAMYFFNGGFGHLTDQDKYYYLIDCNQAMAIPPFDTVSGPALMIGKAFMQYSNSYFIDLK